MFIPFVLCLFVTNIRAIPIELTIDTRLNDEWEIYKTKFGKQYESNVEISRRLIWEENLRYIRQHNLEYDLGKHSYYLGLNQFTDMTNEEFKVTYLGNIEGKLENSNSSHFIAPENIAQLPATVDWRTKGYVTPVKNQNPCGSCYAFSATGSLEGQHFRKTGKLISFSEQQILDCNDFNYGCNGGSKYGALLYIKKNGIESEKSYPYVASKGTCKYDKSKVEGTCTGTVFVPPGDEVVLAAAVATVGPISVSIDASHDSFQYYEGGIYDEPNCSSTSLNHAVLAVGYGTENGKNYWLVKNSWGTTWGLSGYIKMSKDADNQCGIAKTPLYPLV